MVNERFVVIPQSVLTDDRLAAEAKLLFADIVSMSKQKGYCYVKNSKIMADHNLTERAVQRHIEKLIELKYLEVIISGPKRVMKPIYPDTTVGVNGGEIKSLPRQGGRAYPDTTVGVYLTNRKDNRKDLIPPLSPKGEVTGKEAPAFADDFLKEYPGQRRNCNKPAFYRAWRSHGYDKNAAARERQHAGLRRWKDDEQWLRDNGRFVPHPSTFINQNKAEEKLTEEPDAQPQQAAPERDAIWKEIGRLGAMQKYGQVAKAAGEQPVMGVRPEWSQARRDFKAAYPHIAELLHELGGIDKVLAAGTETYTAKEKFMFKLAKEPRK